MDGRFAHTPAVTSGPQNNKASGMASILEPERLVKETSGKCEGQEAVTGDLPTLRSGHRDAVDWSLEWSSSNTAQDGGVFSESASVSWLPASSPPESSSQLSRDSPPKPLPQPPLAESMPFSGRDFACLPSSTTGIATEEPHPSEEDWKLGLMHYNTMEEIFQRRSQAPADGQARFYSTRTGLENMSADDRNFDNRFLPARMPSPPRSHTPSTMLDRAVRSTEKSDILPYPGNGRFGGEQPGALGGIQNAFDGMSEWLTRIAEQGKEVTTGSHCCAHRPSRREEEVDPSVNPFITARVERSKNEDGDGSYEIVWTM